MDEHLSDGGLRTVAGVAKRGSSSPVAFGRAIALTAAAALLIGLVVGPIISGHPTLATDTSGAPEHIVTVSGSGEVGVAPDIADVVLGVSMTRPSVAEAQSAAATAMNAVVASLKGNGIADKDIVTVNLTLTAVYDYSGSAPRLVGQQYTNVVKATVRNLRSIAAVVDGVVAAGATTIQGISFRLSDPKSVEAQARQLAMTDARTKADALAGSAGVSVKGVASITETTTTPVTYYNTMDKAAAAGGPSTPILGGTTDVTVTVTVSYLIG